MNEMNENVGRKKAVLWIIGVIVVLIVIFAVLFGTGVIGDSDSLEEAVRDNTAAVAGSIDGDVDSDSDNQVELIQDNSIPEGFVAVSFPVLASLAPTGADDGTDICEDRVVWVTKNIPQTKAVLNAALNMMFEYRDSSAVPGNFVGSHGDLTFDLATIEEGQANIFLSGSVSETDDCGHSRLIIQIKAVAMQFDTVRSVQIYLNGEVIS